MKRVKKLEKLSLDSREILQVVKIRDVKKLLEDAENDSIIRNQMTNLNCLLLCNVGNFVAPALVVVHTVKNLNLWDDKKFEDEGYERDLIGKH